MEKVKFILENWGTITAVVFGLIAVAESIVRLTPTKKDDGAVQRIGAEIKKIMDSVKVPNNIKKPK